ncbi:DUF7255 family protein [Leifsonia aquatica]|uniref:DUF7255 family protein n=1 Tax=Leifsonia aquatica TaxID=144185 RepID=UPI0013B4747F|nr:hypothetical protein [Leifsonia aquatica]
MAKTGARARELNSLLIQSGWSGGLRPSPPRLSVLPAEFAREVMRLYRELGGRQMEPRLAPGAWDLAYDGVIVELDESFHFNRYRTVTLQTSWSTSTPWSTDYVDYCSRWERFAGIGGKRWSNESARRMFGGADPDGVFDTYGAPRWKQRALYDAMKDAAAAAGLVRLSRVSIYDEIDGIRLDDVLYQRAHLPADRIGAWVKSRMVSPRL